MIKLFNRDCLDTLDKMIDKGVQVDCIVTDPPYKVTSRGGRTSAGGMMLNKEVRKGTVFKHNNIHISDWLYKLYAILKESGHCYIMTNNKNLYPFLQEIDKSDFKLIKTMVWVKDNKIMSQAYMSQFEFILFLRKGKFKKINNCGTSDILEFKNPKNKKHPSEKPIDLLETLILNSSDENDLILDPFMGSGSTLVACKNLNRRGIGIELDKEYFEIAQDRIYK